MKIAIVEYNGCFSIDLEPETVEDAASVLRLTKNGIKEVRGIYTYASKDKKIVCSVVIGKRKKPNGKI